MAMEDDLRSRVESLERLAVELTTVASKSVETVQVLQQQVIATMYVAAVSFGRLQAHGLLDGNELAEIAVAQLPGGEAENPECADLIRKIMVGEEMPKPPPSPTFRVIKGGKADGPPTT